MMSKGPDLLVGIDVGMSCTGIAYLNRTRGNHNVQIFKEWGGYRVEDKAPTRLKYLDGRVSSWGFRCETDHQGDVKEWFKTELGKMEDGKAYDKSSQGQVAVRRVYEDYMACVYEQLRSEFSHSVLNGKQWDTASIQFLFSVPATWSTDLVDDFCQIARKAGFGSQPGFEVIPSLTEPHAVAAYTLSNEGFIKAGQSMLIIDAGGGTVDLCFLVINDAQKGKVTMSEVQPVQGEECGSTFIDAGFQEMVENRLRNFECMLTNSVEEIAWEMMRSVEFQSNKKEVGSDRWTDSQTFQLKIPGLKRPLSDPTLRVKDGDMQFFWSELKQIFDMQILKINNRMDKMMDRHSLELSTRFVQVDHVLLSGGLGSSKYIQQGIATHIAESKLGALQKTQSHQSTEPQLSVCRGLIEHAIQSLESSTMFRSRLSRTSLGIPCRVRVRSMSMLTGSKRKLQREAEEKGRITPKDDSGQRWISGAMDWFVKYGDSIQENRSIRYPYIAEFEQNVVPSHRKARIPIMTSLQHPIPSFKDRETVRLHTTLEADLSQASPSSISKKKNIWGMGSKKPIVQVRFLIEAVVGVADVKFRCLDLITKKPISSDAALDFKAEERSDPLPTCELSRYDYD